MQLVIGIIYYAIWYLILIHFLLLPLFSFLPTYSACWVEDDDDGNSGIKRERE